MGTGDAETRRWIQRWASGRGEVLLPLLLFLAVVALWAFRTHDVLNTGDLKIATHWGIEDFRALIPALAALVLGIAGYAPCATTILWLSASTTFTLTWSRTS